MKFLATTPEKINQIKNEMCLINKEQQIPWIGFNPEKNEYYLDTNLLSGYMKKNTKILFVRNKATEKTLKYIYFDGAYRNVSDDQIMAAIKQFIPQSLMSSKDVKEIFFDLTTQDKFVKVEDLDDVEELINFQDGLYYVEEDVLKPHTADIFSTIQIPAKYKDVEVAPDEAPVFDKYLATLCGTIEKNGELKRNIEKEFLLLQFIGLSISNYCGYRTKKALFLEGVGNSGKSQIKSLVEYLLGPENYSTASLQDLAKNFGLSSVYR